MTAMNLPTFLSVVRASRLVPEDRLNQLVKELDAEAPEGGLDAAKVAARMKERELISEWQEQKLLQGVHKGFFLGKYKLQRHLGRGGMGSVFLGEHVLMKRPAAIKVLPKARVEDRSYLDRFLLEARAVASLDHANIVKAYNVGNEDQTYYLVMEFVDGKDLERTVLEHGVLGYHAAADYIRQAAEGLHHAHLRKMIHRDIKPGNLLLDKEGTIKVLDMGLAKLTSDSRSLTKEFNEKVLGTTDYLAPEQALDSSKVDFRADVYSLGCTLYFILTGHPPFPKGSVAQRLLKHQVEEPTAIALERPDVPPQLVEICSKMMAKRPEDRYQTAADVSHALTAYLSGEGIMVVSRLAVAGLRVRAGGDSSLSAAGDLSTVALKEPGAADSGAAKLRPAPEGPSAVWASATTIEAAPGSGGAMPPPAGTGAEVGPPPPSSMSTTVLATDSSSVIVQKKTRSGNKKKGGGSTHAEAPAPWYLHPAALISVAALLLLGGGALIVFSLQVKPHGGKRSGAGGLEFTMGSTAALKPGEEVIRRPDGFPMGDAYSIPVADLPAGKYRLQLSSGKRPKPLSAYMLQLNEEPGWIHRIPFAAGSGGLLVDLGEHDLRARSSVALTMVGPTPSSINTIRYTPWAMCGPFHFGGSDADLDAPNPPESEIDYLKRYTGKDGVEVGWKLVDLPNGEVHRNLRALSDPLSENIIMYFNRDVYALKDTDVTFYMGRDDGMKVFLNGEVLKTEYGGTGVKRDHFTVQAKLKKGDNHLLLKISQGNGDWGFYFADVPSPEGNDAPTVRADALDAPDFNLILKYIGPSTKK